MSETPWHKRYHSDALTGFRGLSLELRGAYQTILDLLYDDGGASLRNTERGWAGLMDVSVRKWLAIRAELIEREKIVALPDGSITNSRYLRERAKAEALSEKRAAAGRKGGQAKPSQSEFDLENHAENVAKTGDDSAFSTPENAVKHSPEFVEHPKNGNENNDGTEANASDLPPVRARVPDARSQRPDSREDSSPLDSPSNPDPWPSDLLDVTNRLAKLAGVSLIMPRNLARAMDVVKGWTAEGLDIPGVVVPVIERQLLDRPDQPVSSLAYFDSAIRKAIAVASAEKNAGRSRARPTGPAAKLNNADAADARIVAIRKGLNGSADHAPDKIALSIELDADRCPMLIVTARSGFVASRLDRERLTALAALHLNPVAEIEVRTQ